MPCRVEWPTYKEICRIFDVKYLMFLTSKDDFLVAVAKGRQVFLAADRIYIVARANQKPLFT